MRIVLTGSPFVPLSEAGKGLAEATGFQLTDHFALMEEVYEREHGARREYWEIAPQLEPAEYRSLETRAARKAGDEDWRVITVTGTALLDPELRREFRKDSIIVFLRVDAEDLWKTAMDFGPPVRYVETEGRARFFGDSERVEEAVLPHADGVVEAGGLSAEETAQEVMDIVAEEMALRMRAANTYGEVIRITTFGESHGPAIGVVLDGVRPGLEISLEEIQREMLRRRPGQSAVTTPRQEADKVHILSGVFEGKTTGAPIAMVVYSKDQDPSKYEGLREVFRPGHADFTFYRKYGIRDHRGGGRSSGRETAARVAAGAVARSILAKRGVRIVAHAIEVAGIRAENFDFDTIEQNPVRCADPEAAKKMEKAILAAKERNDSVGGIVQLEIHGVPPGLGDPVFGKLDARLVSAVMTVGAIKGIEVGRGFELAKMNGSRSNDRMADGKFRSNNAGGITGGISTGQPILIRFVVKPTSSIAQPQETIDTSGRDREIEVHGRHDPCIVPRIIPVAEHMAALAILDAWEIQERLRPGWESV